MGTYATNWFEGIEYGEIGIVLVNGMRLVTQDAASSPAGVDYVRILAPDGKEIGYWASEEWRDEPEQVMGAIVGALSGSRR